MSRPFRFLLIIASTLVLLSAHARAQSEISKATHNSPTRTIIGPIRGVDYGPFHNGESPSGPCNLVADADQDSPILARMGNYVRVYSVAQTPCDYYDMAPALLANGLNVIPSAYVWCLDTSGNNICTTQTDTGVLANNAEVTALINLMASLSPADRAKIPFVVVGKEAVSFGGMTWGDGKPTDLKPFVFRVMNALPGIKVTTAEIYYQYLAGTVQPCVGNNGNGPTLLGLDLDLVFFDIYPYSEGFPLDQSVSCILNIYGSLNSAYPLNMPIVISETGWPTITSVSDQQTYWQSVITAARQNNIEYLGFEAFDEAWKNPPAVEATWGLWYATRQPKAPGRIVSFNPSQLVAFPASGSAPLLVTFTASGLSLPMTYTVNFGDGTTGALTRGGCIGMPPVGGNGGIGCSGSASHTYSVAGTDTATLLNASAVTLCAVTITVGHTRVAQPSGVSPSPVGGVLPLPITHR
jgi:exo-beta-1,3-glucanase (GH17 family)